MRMEWGTNNDIISYSPSFQLLVFIKEIRMNKDTLLQAAVGLPTPIVPKSMMVVDDSLERQDNYEQHESLQQLYYNAVQCLVKYDATIISLQQEVKSNNERIEFLEAKLVQMSFELASSKAQQDEQRQYQQ